MYVSNWWSFSLFIHKWFGFRFWSYVCICKRLYSDYESMWHSIASIINHQSIYIYIYIKAKKSCGRAWCSTMWLSIGVTFAFDFPSHLFLKNGILISFQNLKGCGLFNCFNKNHWTSTPLSLLTVQLPLN